MFSLFARLWCKFGRYCSDLTTLIYSIHDDRRAGSVSGRTTESHGGRTEQDARRAAGDEGRAASNARHAARCSGAHRRTRKEENAASHLCESQCEEARGGREESAQEA